MTLLENQARFSTTIGANLAPPVGARKEPVFGRALVGITEVTVWPLAISYPRPTAPVQLEVVSSDPGDNAAGLGARAVVFDILDNSMTRQRVVAPMHPTDGTIAQPIALPSSTGGAPSAANTCWRVMSERVSPPVEIAPATVIGGVGTINGSNIGNISIRVAGAGPTLGYIAAGRGRGQTAFFTTAADEVALIPPTRAYNNSTNFECDWIVEFQFGVGLDATPSNAPWWPSVSPIEINAAARETIIGDGWASMLEVPPLTDIEVRAIKSGLGPDIEVLLMTSFWIKTVGTVPVPPVPLKVV